jgi:hypothetical protein
VFATHLVGGEFEMLHVEGNRYLFRQIQYFDVVNGNPEAEDQNLVASVFRKKDNLFVKSISFSKTTREMVRYTNPVCSDERLITRRIVYEAAVTLEPELFSDPEGYYVVWERCCRNNIITNIVSPDQTGQTFYLEFPPIVRRGTPFVNNSPQLFPPLSDYACVNRSYYADFRGTDADGDSLVYSLVTPFNVHDPGEPVPTPQPLPIPPVQWTAGISEDYQVPGNPTLGISTDGILRVTPTEEGLFVFSVKCEEYRDGVKIGEVRRDFQLFVIDCVPPGEKPDLLVQAPGNAMYTQQPDTIVFAFEDDKCIDFKVTDRDGGEALQIIAEPVNFDLDIGSIIEGNTVVVNNRDDTVQFEVCLPDCPFTHGKPYVVDVMALDGTCPQPQRDTVRLVISSALPPNNPAVFTAPAAEELDLSYVEGDVMQLDLTALDADGDSLMLFLRGRDFDVAQYGISIDTIRYETGEVQFVLQWDFDCRLYDFAEQSSFELVVYIDDKDECAVYNPDSVVLNVQVQLPPNNAPVITLDGSAQPGVIEIYIEEDGSAALVVEDADPADSLSLMARGIGFTLKDVGMGLATAPDVSPATSTFSWDIGCFDIDLGTTDTLVVEFVAEDYDYCSVPEADTLIAMFKVLPPKNHAPQIAIAGREDAVIEVFTGQQVDFTIIATDADNDGLTVRLLQGGDFIAAVGLSPDPVSGSGLVQLPFQWPVSCDMLSDGYATAVYDFVYVVQDDQCLTSMSDTLAFSVLVSDFPSSHDFDLPNAFTPNATDNINTHYFVPDLPVNNCQSQFEKVVILNRWGREVFSSTDRNFEWSGEGVSNGVYYFQLKFTDRIYKGTVSVIR